MQIRSVVSSRELVPHNFACTRQAGFGKLGLPAFRLADVDLSENIQDGDLKQKARPSLPHRSQPPAEIADFEYWICQLGIVVPNRSSPIEVREAGYKFGVRG